MSKNTLEELSKSAEIAKYNVEHIKTEMTKLHRAGSFAQSSVMMNKLNNALEVQTEADKLVEQEERRLEDMYRDIENRQINKQKWNELRKQAHYRTVDVFQVGNVQVRLEWHGVNLSQDSYEQPKLYEVFCYVKNADEPDFSKENELLAQSGYRYAKDLKSAYALFAYHIGQSCALNGHHPYSSSDNSGPPDQEMNEYQEPDEWRIQRINDDPDVPNLEDYNGEESMYA